MELDDRESIHNTAINAFGAQGVNTTMYVSVFALQTFILLVVHETIPFLFVAAGTMYTGAWKT